MDELIWKQDALDALMAERKHLLANGQKGAEHVLTHHGYNVIDELPPVQSDVPDTNVGDMISRQVVIDALEKVASFFPYRVPGNRDTYDKYSEAWNDAIGRAEIEIEKLQSAQPTILRCKDCKYWKEKPLYAYCEKMYRMGILDVLDYATEENDFCSMAEKRGEADG